MDLRERVAYLRGLADGFELKAGSKKDRMMVEVLEVLSLFADKIERVSDECDELSSYIDSLDEDLADMEDRIYGDDLDEYDDLDDYHDFEEFEDDMPGSCGDDCCCQEIPDDSAEGTSEDSDD